MSAGVAAGPWWQATLRSPALGRAGVILAGLAVWEVLARAGWITPQVLPAPSKVFATAIKMALGALKRRAGHALLFILVTFLTITRRDQDTSCMCKTWLRLKLANNVVAIELR